MELITTPLHDMLTPVTLSYMFMAMGLNIHYGYTGLLNFGQAAFAAVGAYTLAVSVASFDIPFLLAILLGFISAILLALLMGVPTLRLRADYLAIVTIAVAESARLIFSTQWKSHFNARDGVRGFVGGFRDLNPLPDPLPTSDGDFLGFSRNDLWVMIVGWTLVAVISVLVWLMMRSPWGRVLKGIREDEDAVRSLGKNVYSYKMQALVVGGVIGAIGGFIGALGNASVTPDDYNTDVTFVALTMLILGGAARVMSPVIGAMLFWGLFSFVGVILDDVMTSNQITMIRWILVGVSLMLLMIFRPQGLFGDKKELAIDAR